MEFDRLTPAQRRELEVMNFRSAIDHEDEQRRLTTRFGYYLKDWWLALTRYILVVLVIQLVIVFGVVFAGGLPRGAVNDPRWLLLFLPMATIPIYPFFIMKARYARWGLVIVAILLAAAWLGLMWRDWVLGMLL